VAGLIFVVGMVIGLVASVVESIVIGRVGFTLVAIGVVLGFTSVILGAIRFFMKPGDFDRRE
jgi:hypothetical protein